MSYPKPLPQGSQSGGILVLFCLLIAVIVSVMTYSFYMGRQVEERIALQNASDAAALATTNHATQGLNMIGANNLTIGASLHVAASMPIIATYASAAYAFSTGAKDIGPEFYSLGVDSVGKYLPPLKSIAMNSRYQKKIWNRLALVTSIYMAIATGTTKFNNLLVEYWMIPAPLRGVEVARLNMPGSLAMSIQQAGLVDDPENLVLMHYLGLSQSSAEKSICHTLKASRAISDKAAANNVAKWALGPLMAFRDSKQGGGLESIGDMSSKVADFIGAFNKIAPIYLTYTDCGWGSKGGALSMLQNLGKNISDGAFLVGQGAKATAALTDSLLAKKVSGSKSFREDEHDGRPPGCFGADHFFKDAVRINSALALANPRKLKEGYAFYATIANIKNEYADKKYPSEPQASDYNCHLDASTGLYRYKHSDTFVDASSCMKASSSAYKVSYDYWEKNRAPYTCSMQDLSTGVFETKYDSLSFVDAGKNKQCLDLRVIEKECGFVGYFGFFQSMNFFCANRIRDKALAFKRDVCQGISFGDGDSDQVEEIVSYREQMKVYDGSDGSGRRLDQIGFVYVKDQAQFERSLRFLTLVGSPLRTEEELARSPCPSEYMVTVDGVTRCRMDALFDFAGRKRQGSSAGVSNAVSEKFEKETDAMRAGMQDLLSSTQGQLATTWARTQWSMTYMEAAKKTTPDPRLRLFWPDWYPATKTRNYAFISEALKHFIGGTDKENDAKVLAAFQ